MLMFFVMLSVIILNVVMLSVLAPWLTFYIVYGLTAQFKKS
jgi:hypothetical protein